MAGIEAALGRARAGRGSALLIEGPAGVGKTSLLGVAGTIALAAGFLVLTAIGGAIEIDLPWNLVRQLFDGVIGAPDEEQTTLLSGAAALAAPALGLARGAEAGSMHGLYWLTASLAERQPVLLSVDDAHWGDEPSLRFLAYLAPRLADLPVVLAVVTRTGEQQPEPLAAVAAAETRLLTPSELSPGASAELTRRRLGDDAAEELCRACHRVTGGSPFLLEALLEQLDREGIEPATAGADAVAGATPESVRRSLLLRLARLPEATRRLAEALAVLGAEASPTEAAALADLEPSDAAAAADDLARTSILRPGTELSFRHPLVREVVYGAIPEHERGRRHGRAARLLADAGDEGERVQAQLLLSEPAADEWVVGHLRRNAAVALAEGAPQTAVELLGRALREPPPDASRAEVMAELGRAELAAGRPGAAEHLRAAVAITEDPRSRARTALDLGRSLYVTGRPHEAATALERGFEELRAAAIDDPSLSGELRATWLAVARTEIPLRARATELALQVAVDPPAGNSYGERALLAQVAGELTFAGEPRVRPLELAREALAEGRLIAEETADGLNWIAAMGALGWGDDFDAYDRLQMAAQAEARRRGSVIGLVNGSYGLSFSHFYRGLLASAVASATQAIEAAAEGWIFFLPAARAQLAWSLIELGELDAAEHQLRQARADPTWADSSMQALVLEAQARIELARGEPGRALASALAAGRVAGDAHIPNPSVLPWRSRAAIAAARLGDQDRAQELAGEAVTLSRRFGAPRALGMALIAQGTARADDGIEALEEAVAVLHDSPARLELARALTLLGAALRRQGRTKAAREPLAAGLDIASECGAKAIASRARDELTAAGARPRRGRSTGREALTPAELRTAELAASGFSNRKIAESLFVSRRTVETHLTHTYRKLGIDSRERLTEALGEATHEP